MTRHEGGRGWAGVVSTALAVFLGAAAPPSADASFVSRVSITSLEMHNYQCMDEWCNRADMFARAFIVLSDGSERCATPARPRWTTTSSSTGTRCA